MIATQDFPEYMPSGSLLEFGSDKPLRNRWFVPESFAHPAKCHLGLLRWIIEKYTQPGETIADPMAGIGSVLYAASLQRHVIAREIEPRWLEIMHLNAAHIAAQAGLFADDNHIRVGNIDIGQENARLPWRFLADHIIFSPPYGNEASSSPLAHRALVYKQLEGRRWKSLLERAEAQRGSYGSVMFHYGTHPAQIGHYRGKRYLTAMEAIYLQANLALRPGGFLILITKDHISQGRRVETAVATVQLCESLGFSLRAWHQRHVYPLALWQRRRKEKGLPVVEEEDILVFCHAGGEDGA